MNNHKLPYGELRKYYMDDIRPAPAGFFLVRTVAEMKRLLTAGVVDFASFDHDMGACETCVKHGRHIGRNDGSNEQSFFNWCQHHEDGTHLVNWMIETGHWPKYQPRVHSMNPIGRARMEQLIARHFPRTDRD